MCVPKHDVEREVQAEPIHIKNQIPKSDLGKYGFTASWLDCNATLRETARQKHSKACRSMIEAELKNDPRLVAERTREEEHVARRLDEADNMRTKTDEKAEDNSMDMSVARTVSRTRPRLQARARRPLHD